ncbi:hypothetical protein EV702DRAFT_138704 [Suillus placidus]|uniref:NACHT domain-containing protein n=1 Tax=Suillus placidus TaxID=48579 RepID=A0A9P7D510_9AGAM|nr:hypothetical protein EV702DRAFT_138704 [Suillus placidus]
MYGPHTSRRLRVAGSYHYYCKCINGRLTPSLKVTVLRLSAEAWSYIFHLPRMIDPFTGGLTVVHVVQTIAQVSALLYGYIASVRDADSACQTLLDELSSIIGVLTTVTEIEKDPSLPDNLRHVLSKLMAENGPVTKLQRELKNLLPNEQESKKMGTISKLKWPFKEKKAAAITERLKGFYRDITTVLAIDSRNMLREVDRGVKEVGRVVQELKEAQEVQEAYKKDERLVKEAREKDEERRKFFQWMKPMSCTEKHATSHGQRNPRTGRWIFHAEEYKTWNTSDHAFLWLNGQPGHGKTILASSIIDEIQGSGEAEPQTLGYFYCNFRDDQTTSAAAVLRSLVVQLLQQSQDDDWITQIGEKQKSNTEGNLDSLRDLRQQQHDAKPHPTALGFLRRLLVEASTLVRRPVLVIDALDECKDYPKLVGHLVNLAEDARLRLFVTSRSESDITKAFHNFPTISLKDRAEEIKADIRVHITEQLKTQEKLSRLSDTLKDTILEKLLEKAEGMFRWVQCQLDVLECCPRTIDIKNALNNLPHGLNETYDRIIVAVKERGSGYEEIAQSCLFWLAGAFTPLTLDQLNEAMMIVVGKSSLDPDHGVMDPMDIVSACRSLVTYDEKTGVVALSHYSVKEYLISRPNNIYKSISDMHARICELLITYVLCDFVDEICAKGEHPDLRNSLFRADISDVSKDHPLLSYAILGWRHLRHVSDEDPDVMDALSRLNSEFLLTDRKHGVLATLDEIMGYILDIDRWLSGAVYSPSLLFIPLAHGKPWMIEFVVKQHPHILDADIAPGWGSPLIFAITENPDCLSVLLKLGVDPNKLSFISTKSYRTYFVDGYYAPISWAAVTGSEVAVDLLLSQTEVNKNLPNDILHTAVRADNPSHKSIRKFRQRGADVNFTVDGSTPIHYYLSTYYAEVYSTGHSLPVVKALVEPSCNLSLQDRTARTILHWAVDRNREEIITYLLEQNAGLSATATLLPDMWNWATNKTWFLKFQAAALAADKLCTRIKGNIVDATAESQIVEFSVAATADRDNPDPIYAVVISAILNGELSSE